MKVLVTGAGGFIGRPVTAALQRAGHAVTPITRAFGDLTEAATWNAMPDAEVVVHLAGKTTGRGTWDNPADFFRANVVATVEALRYCRDRGARLVYLSSYLYGNPATLPLSESAPLSATTPYALSKLQAEDACRLFAESWSLNVTVFRPFNVYGPGQREDFLISSIVAQAKAGNEIVVADLHARRDYVYVGDLVDAIVRALSTPLGFRIFNIGTGVSHSVGDIVAILEQRLTKKLRVCETGAASPIRDCWADVTAVKRALGWAPQVSLEVGLQRTLEA